MVSVEMSQTLGFVFVARVFFRVTKEVRTVKSVKTVNCRFYILYILLTLYNIIEIHTGYVVLKLSKRGEQFTHS